MPHDSAGNDLKVGDIVTLRCEVTQIHLSEKACNVTAKAAEYVKGEPHAPVVVCNSRYLNLVQSPTPPTEDLREIASNMGVPASELGVPEKAP
ncbi:hypothetical protein LCGC14_2118610 [marine sediment metagenome]|uniref:Uncharacterized protein n=1 Tax=marine sediment metagenome TaxID=412755 RepID=A0A0F9H179_9ZZZZ